jgi:hypothetical protein
MTQDLKSLAEINRCLSTLNVNKQLFVCVLVYKTVVDMYLPVFYLVFNDLKHKNSLPLLKVSLFADGNYREILHPCQVFL